MGKQSKEEALPIEEIAKLFPVGETVTILSAEKCQRLDACWARAAVLFDEDTTGKSVLPFNQQPESTRFAYFKLAEEEE